MGARQNDNTVLDGKQSTIPKINGDFKKASVSAVYMYVRTVFPPKTRSDVNCPQSLAICGFECHRGVVKDRITSGGPSTDFFKNVSK